MSQTGKSKRNQRESNLAEKYQSDGPFTTVMIRNIPTEYTQDELIMEVSEVMGFQCFDFFYLPWDTQNDCNIGYVFVNFPDPAAAQGAVRAFSNYNFRLHDSKKVGKVSPAHIQGLENNLRHLQDRAVVLGNHPCSPIVMWKGQKVELSLIFQELRTQDTLRKFENSPSGPRHPAQNDLVQAAAEALKAVPEAKLGETFDDLLDRAAGLSVGAVMNPGLVMPFMNPMAGMQQGMLTPPGSGCGGSYRTNSGSGGASPAAAAYNRMMSAGASGYGGLSPMGCGMPGLRAPASEGMAVPPGQFLRQPEMSAPNPSMGGWPTVQDLTAMGLSDPSMYMMANQAAMRNAYMDDIFGDEQDRDGAFACEPQKVTAPHSWSGPSAPPGLTPPPQQHDGGSGKGRSLLSPASSSPGRHALRPGLQSAPTTPSLAGTNNGSFDQFGAGTSRPASPVTAHAPSAEIKEITMKSADQNLLDKFMAKFGAP